MTGRQDPWWCVTPGSADNLEGHLPTNRIKQQEVDTMTTYNIECTAKELRELKAMREELDAEITALEDMLKAEMTRRNTQELTAGAYSILWTEYTTMRFDSSRFKKENADLAAAYTKTSTARRFIIK